MSYGGEDVRRIDADEKVAGRAKYVDDIDIPCMWYGAVVRTPSPSGRIKKVRFDPSFDWSKVVAATAEDIPGQNVVSIIENDIPLLVSEEFRHYGEGIVLIAAPTKELAQSARLAVKIDFDSTKPVLTVDDAKKKIGIVRAPDNIIAHYEMHKGDIAKGFEESDKIIEGEYRLGHQEHAYVETNGVIALPREDGVMEIIGSLQCPYYVLEALKKIFDWSHDKFSIRQSVIGGAFGGKEDYPSIISGYAALLAYKSGRPVKIVYDRVEDISVTTKRHPAVVKYRTGVGADGLIKAMEINLEMDAGAYVSLSPVVLSRSLIHSTGPYRIPNVSASATAYATNTPPNGAFRGFGVPQSIFAVESHIDELALEIGLGRDEFRRRNVLAVGDTTATGQKLAESVAALDVLEEAISKSDYANKLAPDSKWKTSAKNNKKRGIGISLFFHGGGFTGSGETKLKSRAGIRIDEDGGVTILTAQTDMGQGVHTVFSQIVADVLQIPIGHVRVAIPDTAVVPNSGPTVASRSTMIVGKVLMNAAGRLQGEIHRFAAGRKISFKELALMYRKEKGVSDFIEQYVLPEGLHWDDNKFCGDAYPAYSWACNVAEVEVDIDTFEVSVLNLYLVNEIGKVINPAMASGQVAGGALQGLGYALLEDFKLKDGCAVTNRFQTYIVPTSLDAPNMIVHFIERPYSHGPMGAKGLGEMPMNGPAPAIANAIYDACGVRVRSLPITPEKLLKRNEARSAMHDA